MTDDIKTQLEELITSIENANADVQQGKISDLKHLEQTTTALVAEIQNLDKEKTEELQPLMVQMISKLDDLATNLSAFKAEQDNTKES